MSLGKALGHSMATLTMSAGGGMAEVGRAGAVVPLPHASVSPYWRKLMQSCRTRVRKRDGGKDKDSN